MNLDKDEVEWFMDVYTAFNGAPNENDISFKLPGMLALCEDWITHENIIAKQSRWITGTTYMMMASGTLLFGVAVQKTVKNHRKKKFLKHHESEFLRKMEEDNIPVVLE